MAGLTLEMAEQKLAEWLAADTALQDGQDVTWTDGRRLTQSDAGEVRRNIDYWDNKCKELGAQRAGGRCRTVKAGW